MTCGARTAAVTFPERSERKVQLVNEVDPTARRTEVAGRDLGRHSRLGSPLVRADLADVVKAALEPTHVSVWLGE